MKDQLYYESLLDKFLNGTINPKEESELQEAAKTNQELADSLAEHLQARAAIRLEGEAALKATLSAAWDEGEEIEEKTSLPAQQKTGPRITPYRRWLAIAAMLLAALLLFYFLIPSTVTDQQDYLADALKVPPTVSVRSLDPNDLTKEWEQGEAAYLDKRYLQAIQIFESLKGREQLKDHRGKLKIMLAMSYLQYKTYQPAIIVLSEIEATNPLKEDADWLLALAYLEGGQPERGKTVLQKIAGASSHYKKAEAQKLLNSLK